MKSVKNAAMARAVPHPIEILLLGHREKYGRNNKGGESASLCSSNVDRATVAKPLRPCAFAVDAANRSLHLRRTCEKGYRMQHETSNDSRDDECTRGKCKQRCIKS